MKCQTLVLIRMIKYFKKPSADVSFQLLKDFRRQLRNKISYFQSKQCSSFSANCHMPHSFFFCFFLKKSVISYKPGKDLNKQEISMYLPYFKTEILTSHKLTTSLSFEQLGPGDVSKN